MNDKNIHLSDLFFITREIKRRTDCSMEMTLYGKNDNGLLGLYLIMLPFNHYASSEKSYSDFISILLMVGIDVKALPL